MIVNNPQDGDVVILDDAPTPQFFAFLDELKRTSDQNTNADLVHVKNFGANGGTTDNSAAIQSALNAVRDDGVRLSFNPITYKCNSGLTLLSNSTSVNNYVIDFNGATLDFTSLTGNDIAFRVGATSQSNAHDKEFIKLNGPCIFIGPESANPNTTQTSLTATSSIADTDTLGLSLEFALFVNIESLQIRRFYTGWTSRFVFPFTTNLFISRENYIGAIIQEDSTRAVHISPEFVECHHGLVIKPATDDTLSNQTFVSPRWENCGVPLIIDPNAFGSTKVIAIRSIKLIHPYFESNDFDHVRIGVPFDDTTAGRAIRGSDRDRYVWDVVIDPGFWSRPFASWDSGASKSPLYCASTDEIVIGGSFAAPAMEIECINIPMTMDFRELADATDSSTNNPMLRRLAGDGYVIFDGRASVADGISLDDSYGNVSTVDKLSTGTYEINLKQDYSNFNFITNISIQGWDAHGILQSTTTLSRIDFIMYDAGGTAVDVDKVRVSFSGKME